MDPSVYFTSENCWENIFLTLLPFSSLDHTLAMAGKGSKVFLRRIACENLPLNKKGGRSEHVKDNISDLIVGYDNKLDKVI